MNHSTARSFCLIWATVSSFGCQGASDDATETGSVHGSQDVSTASDVTAPGTTSAAGGEDEEEAAGGSVTSGSDTTQLPTGDSPVTWHQHIAPLVASRCQGCHRDGGIAPFSLESYQQAVAWAAPMAASVKAGTMPPWGARETDECTPPAPFKDDPRLTEQQTDLFVRWAAGDRLEGDPGTAAPLPARVDVELDAPSARLTIPSSVTVEGTSDDFVCFTLDPQLTEPVWMTASQITAGNPAIVHHALIFLDRAGQGKQLADERGQYECFGSPRLDETRLLGAWAPGAVPGVLPENTGMRLEPGDQLVVQVHYHPTGQGPETDATTRVDLKWTQQEPDYVGGIFLIGNFADVDLALAGGPGYGLTTGPDFLIPAGATAHREVNRFWLDDRGNPLARTVPIRVWMVGTHMHYVGKDMKITASTPDGQEQCLLHTPEWDFNWQRGYFFEGAVQELPAVRAGDSLTMRCTYDNSLNNPAVRRALDAQGASEPRDVVLGDETLDEMCLGVFGLAVSRQHAEEFGLR